MGEDRMVEDIPGTAEYERKLLRELKAAPPELVEFDPETGEAETGESEEAAPKRSHHKQEVEPEVESIEEPVAPVASEES